MKIGDGRNQEWLTLGHKRLIGKEPEKTCWGMANVLSCDVGDGYIGVHNYRSSAKCKLKTCVFYWM